MKTFLSILRGINVGGQKKVPMAELKILYEELNFKNVKTFIQSGNVIFQTKNAKDLSKRIEQKILNTYHFNVPVIIRTTEEMQNIINENQFHKEGNININKLHVTFLADYPAQARIDEIVKSNFEPDRFYIAGKEVYLYCPDGYGSTKLTTNFFESRLKVIASTRNWKTTNELFKIMNSY